MREYYWDEPGVQHSQLADLLAVQQLEKDLHFADNQYLVCLTIFYVSYSLLEASSYLVLCRTGRLRREIGPLNCHAKAPPAFHLVFHHGLGHQAFRYHTPPRFLPSG